MVLVKAWGNEKDPLILAVHGWTDNAGSFDTLIPLLPPNYYYYCVDLPSHGRSSHLESSIFVHYADYVVILKFIHDYLNRGKIILMAHSFAGFLATNFVQLYPECVSKLIVFDALHCFARSAKKVYESQKRSIDSCLHFMKKTTRDAPVYSKEDAIRRLMLSRLTPISRKTAEILAVRNLEQVSDGKYRFTIAPHAKYIIAANFTTNELATLAECYPIKCPHLIIFSQNSQMTLLAYTKLLQEYRKNKNFELHIVKGNHECHLQYPENVAPIVTDFLNKHQCKL